MRGKISKQPVGFYGYDKRLKNGRIQRVRVAVFALAVDSEADAYPELGQREKLWLPLTEAARRVEAGLTHRAVALIEQWRKLSASGIEILADVIVLHAMGLVILPY